jgi:hypothetical protein
LTTPDDPYSDLGNHVPALAAAGLLPALRRLEGFLARMAGDDPQRWRRLTLAQLLDHLEKHAATATQNPSALAPEGELEACNLASRALMLLGRMTAE